MADKKKDKTELLLLTKRVMSMTVELFLSSHSSRDPGNLSEAQ